MKVKSARKNIKRVLHNSWCKFIETSLANPSIIYGLIMFSRKTVKVSHPSITFNTVPVARTACQKHLGLYLDEKLNFHDHINAKILKANKGIGIIKRLSNTLPRKSLLTIYKSFIRPHLDYCDIIYDQPNNESFCTKIERIH